MEQDRVGNLRLFWPLTPTHAWESQLGISRLLTRQQVPRQSTTGNWKLEKKSGGRFYLLATVWVNTGGLVGLWRRCRPHAVPWWAWNEAAAQEWGEESGQLLPPPPAFAARCDRTICCAQKLGLSFAFNITYLSWFVTHEAFMELVTLICLDLANASFLLNNAGTIKGICLPHEYLCRAKMFAKSSTYQWGLFLCWIGNNSCTDTHRFIMFGWPLWNSLVLGIKTETSQQDGGRIGSGRGGKHFPRNVKNV